MPDYECTNCGADLNRATTADTIDKPREGDVALCLYCAHLMVYTPKALRDPTPEEQAVFDKDPHVQEAIETVKGYARSHTRPN